METSKQSKSRNVKPSLQSTKTKSFLSTGSSSSSISISSTTGAGAGAGADAEGNAKKKKSKKDSSSPSSKKTGEGSGAAPAVMDALNMPQLWIRANDGAIKVLNNVPQTASSAAEPGVRIKAKKTLKGVPKNESEQWAAFEKQQLEEKEKAAEERKKSMRQRKGTTMDDVLASIPLSGVKITLEQTAEPFRIKDEEINRTLLAQSLQTEKDNLKREMLMAAAAAKTKDEVKKQQQQSSKKPIVRGKAAHHSWYITHDTYLFHLHQPNLMSPLFDLPDDRRLLFGQYEAALDRNEEKVWERPLFRPLENVFLPEFRKRSSIDLSLSR